MPHMHLATQTIVDANDPSFTEPTKPVGPFYNKKEAKQLEQERGYVMRENKARSVWRHIVASPKPEKIIAIEAVKILWNEVIEICAGGVGIPAIEKPDDKLEGVAVVIDKDFGAELFAET